MNTVAISKSKGTATWTKNEMQEQISVALVGHMLAAVRLLEGHPDIAAAVRKEWARLKVENFCQQGVRTPLDLVRVWTEYETNMFGSKMQFWGDEKQAYVEYYDCGCWSALERTNASETDKKAMCKFWEEITRLLAEEFGFIGEEKIGSEPDEAYCTITFTRPA